MNAVIGFYTASSPFGSTSLYLVAVSPSGQNVPSRNREQTVHLVYASVNEKDLVRYVAAPFEDGSYGIANEDVVAEGDIVALQNQDAFRSLLFALTELGTLFVERPLYSRCP